MKIIPHFSLKSLNTFGIDTHAEAFVSVESIDELKTALSQKDYTQKFLLGGGSNMLLTQPIPGLCIHINIKGIQLIEETDGEVIVEAMAGENWHDFVQWTLDNNFGGLENLSLIPGNVGTAVIQNIGAYGVELKDVFHTCGTVEIEGGNERLFQREDVHFGYRDSVFKQEEKGRFVITKLRVRLTKTNHKLSIDYGDIKPALGEKEITPKTIAEAVIGIRKSKLPDPKVLGNSGSFFKNPVVSSQHAETLSMQYPNMPSYPFGDGLTKIPAGWLIEKCGLKGHRKGDAGVHKKQALVLVNYGNATGEEILSLAQKVKKNVLEKFKIPLEFEVNIY